MMIQQVQIESFNYKTVDTELVMADQTKKPIKILAIQDKDNLAIVFNLLFTAEAFATFIKNISGKEEAETNIIENIIPFPRR